VLNSLMCFIAYFDIENATSLTSTALEKLINGLNKNLMFYSSKSVLNNKAVRY